MLKRVDKQSYPPAMGRPNRLTAIANIGMLAHEQTETEF
tara:strand:- start:20678 stop:20794 length:117 start_codon:yes stop_codon:yes gene_type:complete